MARILSIDFGGKRTGLAVTDPMQIIASELRTVPTDDLLDFLMTYTQSEVVETIVGVLMDGIKVCFTSVKSRPCNIIFKSLGTGRDGNCSRNSLYSSCSLNCTDINYLKSLSLLRYLSSRTRARLSRDSVPLYVRPIMSAISVTLNPSE